MLEKDAIQALLDTGAAAAAGRSIGHDDGRTSFVVPNGYTVETIEPLERKLARIGQGVVVHDVLSFTSYANAFKDAGSRLFAEPSFLAQCGVAHISAALDYHDVGKPSPVKHTAVYNPRFSDQWKLWHGACAKPLEQAEFAEFIEENRVDITEPLAAQLLDVVRTFKANRKVSFDSVTYQPNGDVRLGYEDRTEQAGTSGSLPEKLTLGIPVYFRGDLYAVPVWVRYKVGSGAVKFQIKMDRSDLIEAAAFEAVVAKIAADTALPIHLGRYR
jgi:uncharacterized protein YfdQ (DUF2303 family)